MTRLGAPRHYVESLPSTMDALTELALAGAPEGTIVVAGEQTAGRGRAGRAWHAPKGASLLFSLLLRPPLAPHALGPLPLIAGLAIAEGLEEIADVEVRLKWPNDAMIGERKVCGVLMQARSDAGRVEFVNLGVGINVLAERAELQRGATSLLAVTGERFALDEVEAAVLERLTDRYSAFVADAGTSGLRDWLARALYRDEPVAIEQDGRQIRGRFTGVTPTGALRLTTVEGEIEIVAGDLTRGPRRDGEY